MENLNNENKFYELLKTMFSSKIHASIINVNLGTLDDVLLCIDECEKIDVENSQNKIKSLLLNWKEKNYSSLDRYIDVFLDQIIWLNNILQKRIYSADYSEFKNLYDYPSDSEINLQDYYFNLREVHSDGIVIFEYNASCSLSKSKTFVSYRGLINILKDLFQVKKELVVINLQDEPSQGHSRPKNEITPKLKVQALINYYTQEDIFVLSDKGKQNYNSYTNSTQRTGNRESDRKNTYHQKYLKEAIVFLKKKNYELGYSKAEKELEEFNKNIS
jgi:hypothetical protein